MSKNRDSIEKLRIAATIDDITVQTTSTYSSDKIEDELLERDSSTVHKTGNETIEGVKTFTSSPILPTPISDYQGATKKYVDDRMVLGSTVYGLIYNFTDDTFKRVGTGTSEDNVWLSTIATRMNDLFGGDDITSFFNKETTVQGNMKRVVVDNAGTYVKDYNATSYSHPDQTGLLATQSVCVQIPKFYYINVSFISNSKVYHLMLQSLNQFSFDLESIGFSSATSIIGMHVSGAASYTSIVGTVITGIVSNAFVRQDNSIGDVMYLGAFMSYNTGSGYKSTCTTTGTSTPVYATASQTIATFRRGHQTFSSSFYTQNWFQREALNFTCIIERGTFLTEVNGINLYSKWEGYSWTANTSDGMVLGLTLPLGNATGVIRDSSNRAIANSYRGIEGYHSHLWEFVDGINIINGAVYVAKVGTYTSDISTTPYFSLGVSVPTAGSGLYISEVHPGTFLPKTASATNLTKYTDGFWSSTGNRIVVVSGGQAYPGLCGLLTWTSNNDSSSLGWNVSSRFSAVKNLT